MSNQLLRFHHLLLVTLIAALLLLSSLSVLPVLADGIDDSFTVTSHATIRVGGLLRVATHFTAGTHPLGAVWVSVGCDVISPTPAWGFALLPSETDSNLGDMVLDGQTKHTNFYFEAEEPGTFGILCRSYSAGRPNDPRNSVRSQQLTVTVKP